MRKITVNEVPYQYSIGKQYIKIRNLANDNSKAVLLSLLRPDVYDFFRERDRNHNYDGMVTPKHIATWILNNNF